MKTYIDAKPGLENFERGNLALSFSLEKSRIWCNLRIGYIGKWKSFISQIMLTVNVA